MRAGLVGMAAAAGMAAAGGGAAAEETHTVTMAEMTYSPAAITASLGDRIRFVNDDEHDHAVFVPTRGFAIDLGTQAPGEERVMPLLKAGRFEVECVFHDHMLLTVEVRP